MFAKMRLLVLVCPWIVVVALVPVLVLVLVILLVVVVEFFVGSMYLGFHRGHLVALVPVLVLVLVSVVVVGFFCQGYLWGGAGVGTGVGGAVVGQSSVRCVAKVNFGQEL